MSRWGNLRKQATEAGACHADGGDDRRSEFASKGRDLLLAYDTGYQNQQRSAKEAAEAFDHPFRQIERDANSLYMNTESSDVEQLARLIERLAQQCAEENERRG